MGVNYEALLESSNAFWVLSKISLQINKFPLSNEKCEAETYPTDISGFRFLRELRIKGNEGADVVGHSEWCVLDATTFQLRRSNSIVYPFNIKRRTDNVGLEFIKERFLTTEEDYVYTYKVMLTDIDCNKHTNNVSYAKMAINSFDLQEFNTFNFSKIEIKFINQSYFNDEIKVYKKIINDTAYVEGKILDKQIFSVIFK